MLAIINPIIKSINPQHFAVLFIILFTIDFFFISYVLGPIFGDNVKTIQGTKMEVKKLPAAFAWFCTVFSLYYFIIRENRSEFEAAILGFLAYGIFDGTNLAIFKKYSLKAFFIDILWGTTLFYISTLIFNSIRKYLS
tara:strand:- start:562 stop:975 length:414 start_codon:yes stop_codon:yes gene_type:complete